MAKAELNFGELGGGVKYWSQRYTSNSVPQTITLDFEPKYVFCGLSWQGQNAMYQDWIDGDMRRYFRETYDTQNSISLTVSGNTLSFGTARQYLNDITITAIG